ncbi:MAG: hypothetical protein KME47_21385 [Nodosilinea sp. WJT8-NPBG4]|jgi:hypothetical protein|nr:hypothetical protein [Nodosilinea sp. WJT8-NPBG4]
MMFHRPSLILSQIPIINGNIACCFKVGRPLTQLRGILSGVPEFIKSHENEP